MLNKQQLSREEALDGVPVGNPAVTENWINARIVQLTYPVLQGNKIAALLSRFGKSNRSAVRHKTLELDLLGSYVWKLINGNATVKEISLIFCNEFQLELSEAQMSVSAFLREIGRQGIIAIR